jgi:hypothetical protein
MSSHVMFAGFRFPAAICKSSVGPAVSFRHELQHTWPSFLTNRLPGPTFSAVAAQLGFYYTCLSVGARVHSVLQTCETSQGRPDLSTKVTTVLTNSMEKSRSRGSSVNIVTDYGLDRGSIPDRDRGFFF